MARRSRVTSSWDGMSTEEILKTINDALEQHDMPKETAFEYARRNLEQNLQGCTLTMDQARQLAEIIVLAVRPTEREARNDVESRALISIQRQLQTTSGSDLEQK